jgi:ABC-type multidrug transport system fused ATPase/permease subunit
LADAQHLPEGRRQAGDRHLKFHDARDNLAAQIAFLTVLAVGGAQVASGAVAVSTLVAFLLYIYYLMPAINQVTGAVSDYQVGAAAITRIHEVEALPIEPTGHPASPPASDAAPATVAFEDVHFRYDPGLPYVHHGVSFAVPAGGMTAIVGPSGAGKTTVFSLIERFYEPSSGHARVDGRDVRDWPLPTCAPPSATSNRTRPCSPAACATTC